MVGMASDETPASAIARVSNLGTLTRHEIFQTSLMSALLDGVYDGDVTVAQLLGHGNFGLGTFNALDGEMFIVGGECIRMRGDGSVSRADLTDRTPFAIVTNFVPHLTVSVSTPMPRSRVVELVERTLGSSNYLFAVRLRGRFSRVRTRTVVKQEKPYRPMREAVENEPVLEFENIDGTVGGFRTPLYGKGIGVPGGHMHFVDDALEHGGHVLDFDIEYGEMQVSIGTDLHLQLPLNDEFQEASLAPEDLEAQLSETENHG